MKLTGKKIAYLIGPEFQDEEGTEPKEFLTREGAAVIYIGPEKRMYEGKNRRRQVQAEKTFDDVSPDEFDALIIPGGHLPMHLRSLPEAVDFVKRFARTGKLIAAICHGPQLLAEAGLLKGKKITSYELIQEEMKSAAANWVNEPVVIDGNLITSRKPADIPEFDQAILEALT